MTTENLQIKEYSATEAGLAQLRKKYADVQFDLATKEGDEEARAARRELVKLRTSLEAKRKELKAPALAHAMAIDSEAKRITAQIKALEEPIDAQIKAEEKRKEEEKAERERIERERVLAILAKIDVMRGLAHESAFDTSEQIQSTLTDLSAMEIADDEFAEFTEEATKVQAVAIDALSELLGRAKAREEEAAKLAAERAELERQRQEQEARETKEREAREAEARKLADERAEFERQRAEFEAQRAAAEKPVQEASPVEPEPGSEETVRFDFSIPELKNQLADARHPVQALIEEAGGQVKEIASLPDGSGFAVGSFPLPTGHWLTAEGKNVPPMPLRMAAGPARNNMASIIRLAAQYAVRASTMNGAEEDFDPDAMVQNMVVGLIGYWTEDGTSSDEWDNPSPIPPIFDGLSGVEREA